MRCTGSHPLSSPPSIQPKYCQGFVCVPHVQARLLRLIPPYHPNTSTASHATAQSLATESLSVREDELLRVLVLTVAHCHPSLPTNPVGREEERDAPPSVEGSSAEHVGATRGPPTSGGSHSDADEAQHNGGVPGGAPKGGGERDVVASVLAALPPNSLRKVLLCMVVRSSTSVYTRLHSSG